MLTRWELAKLYHLLTRDTYASAIWLTIFFTIVSALLPSNKLFFVVATAYLLGLVWITQSIYKALLLAFFPFMMMNIGQVYITTAIAANKLSHLSNSEGRDLYFRFSPFFVLLITSIALFVLELFRRKGKVSFSISQVSLLLSILMSLIAVFFTKQFPTYSFTIVLGAIGMVSFVFLMQLLLTEASKEIQLKLLKTFLGVLIVMTLVDVAVGFGQFFTHSTLHLRIEQSTVIPTFGTGADEDSSQFRPIGLHTHANEFANALITTLFSVLFLIELLRAKKSVFPEKFELWISLPILIMILLTQSRASYLALGLAGILFFVRQKELALDLLNQLKQLMRPYKLLFVIAALFFIPLVTRRLIYTVYSFGSGGGITTRVELEKVAYLLIQKDYLWGVGPGMFIPAAFKESPNGVMKYFPESVHNGFLLYLTENGIFASFFLITFLLFFLKQVEKVFPKTITTIFLAGLLALCCMMYFHPFQNIPSIFIFVVWIGMYGFQKKQHDER